jgi:nucleotide-binding universal stress UspA family protein
MIGQILVTTDGSSRSDGALRMARAFAQTRQSAVRVVSVIDPARVHGMEHSLIAGATSLAEPYQMTKRRATVARQLERIGTAGWSISVLVGDPGPTIARFAEEVRSTIVLLGAPLDRGVEKEKMVELARLTAAPLLAVPSETMHPPRTALVGVDFSAFSVAAARTAAELLQPGSTLHLIHVALALPRWPHLSAAMAEWERTYRLGAATRLATLSREILRSARFPLHVETRVVCGEPVSELMAAAEHFAADLLAVGTRGHELPGEGFAGSVAAPLFHEAGCSVLFHPTPHSHAGWPGTRMERHVAIATGVADPQLV